MALGRIGRGLLARADRSIAPLFARGARFQADVAGGVGAPGAKGAVPAGILKGEIGEVSGVPSEHLRRSVVIFQPSKVVTQSGSSKWKNWRIAFHSTQKWENPLMGWTSTSDPLANVGEAGLSFDSREAAVQFAEKYGWDYEVREPKQPMKKPKSYSDNFRWRGPVPQN